MTKFSITPERMSEACGIIETMNLVMRDMQTAIRVAPRFVIEADQYAVVVERDADGDITKFVGYEDVFTGMASVSAGRMREISDELYRAAVAVLGLKPRTPQEAHASEGV
jgi:hypothetical protein